MEVHPGSTTSAGVNVASSYLSEEDAEELLVITGQIRRVASIPPGNRLLLNALSALEELRERVTPPQGYRDVESLGDEITEESHPY